MSVDAVARKAGDFGTIIIGQTEDEYQLIFTNIESKRYAEPKNWTMQLNVPDGEQGLSVSDLHEIIEAFSNSCAFIWSH